MIRRLALLSALSLAPHALSAQSPFDRTKAPTLAPTPPLTVPTVRSGRLANGVALKVVEHRELPLVQVTLQIAGGGRLDGATPGLATFTANLLDEGAGSRDATALQAELAYLGASLQTSANWDATTVSLKVIRRNLDAALDLMADVVLRPRFTASEVRKQRDLRAAGLLQQRDQPTAIAGLAFSQLVFPKGHPYHNALGGDSSSTASLDSLKVRDFYSRTFHPGRATFTVVGDLTEADAQRLLAARFASWRAAGTPLEAPPVTVTPVTNSERKLFVIDKPNAAQTVITLGAPGLERTNADYAAVQVMNTILGGSFSSRLNSNLRETKGYTYGISSRFQWQPLPGPFTVGTSVRTNVTDSSLVEIFGELKRIREGKVDDAELARAKAYIVLGLPGDLESTAQVANQITSLSAFGLSLDWLREYGGRVNAVTAEDVQRVAQKYIPESTATLVIVGDLAKIRSGIEALRLGPITTLDIAQVAK